MIGILNKKTIITLALLLIIALALPLNTNAKSQKNIVNIYFFHSKTCSHCLNEEKFLNKLEKKYKNIKIHHYEISNESNNESRIKILELYELKTYAVPLTIIGDTPYVGYKEEASDKLFIKTIEYYSKYGYKDRVGELLELEDKTNYPINEKAPSIEKFIKQYGNYKLIGQITTDNLDTTANAIILGFISQINIIKIITTILVIIILTKLQKNKTLLLSLYLIISYILNTTNIIPNITYNIITTTIILLLLTLYIIKYKKTKEKFYLSTITIILVAIATNYLENTIFPTYPKIFIEIINLHNLTGLDKISYYGNYLAISLIINMLIVLIYDQIKNAKKGLK